VEAGEHDLNRKEIIPKNNIKVRSRGILINRGGFRKQKKSMGAGERLRGRTGKCTSKGMGINQTCSAEACATDVCARGGAAQVLKAAISSLTKGKERILAGDGIEDGG